MKEAKNNIEQTTGKEVSTMKCEQCGSSFEGNFCPYCGTKAQTAAKPILTALPEKESVIPSTQANPFLEKCSTDRKRIRNIWIAFIILIIVLIIVLSLISSFFLHAIRRINKELNLSDDYGISPPSSSSVQIPSEHQKVTISTFVEIIHTQMEKKCTMSYDIRYTASQITINLWQEGAADYVIAANNGYFPSYAAWENIVDIAVELYDNVDELMEVADLANIKLVVNVLNDKNRQEKLLIVTNDKITYNAVK